MRVGPAGVRDGQIIVPSDENAPLGSVHLICPVIGRSDVEAFAVAAKSSQLGKAACGSCPPEALNDMLFIGGRLNVRLLGGEALRSAAPW
jgi:hypothetical protein